MQLTAEQVSRLAQTRRCPRCSLDKTMGNALCRRCRTKLPAHMRRGLEHVSEFDANFVARAMRAAANYFNVHFQSVKNFGGGKKR